MDTVELMAARLAVIKKAECSALERAKSAYGEKCDPMMLDSKRDVADLLHEEAEARSVHKRPHPKPRQRSSQRPRKKKNKTNRNDYDSAGVHFERCVPAFSSQLEKVVEFSYFCGIISINFLFAHKEGDLDGIIGGKQVYDALAEMVALSRSGSRLYKGIVSKLNIKAGREEMKGHLSAKLLAEANNRGLRARGRCPCGVLFISPRGFW